MSPDYIASMLDPVLVPAGVLSYQVKEEKRKNDKGWWDLLGLRIEIVKVAGEKLPPPQDYAEWLAALQDKCEEVVQYANSVWVRLEAPKLTVMDESVSKAVRVSKLPAVSWSAATPRGVKEYPVKSLFGSV